MANKKTKKGTVKLIIVLFSVIITLFVYNYNYFVPQLALMFMSPLLLLREGVGKRDMLPIVLMLSILMTAVTHPAAFRISTVGYSLLYVTTFIYYTKVFDKSGINPADFQKLVKGIIAAYAIVLAIQIVSRLLGIGYILNASYNTEEGLKFNSLMFEPSAIGPIITILMYAYIKIEELRIGRKLRFSDLFNIHNKITTWMYLFASIFCFSVTTLITTFILMLYFIRIKHIISGAAVLILLLYIFFSLGTEAGERILTIAKALPSMDVKTIYEADPSGSARIAPIIVFFNEFNIFSPDFWLGHGCDYGNLHIWHMLVGEDTKDDSMAVPGIFAFIYDYGMIAFLIFLKFIHSLCKFKSHTFFIYLTCFFLTGFNMASTWLFFMIAYTLNKFDEQKILVNEQININSHCDIQCVSNA